MLETIRPFRSFVSKPLTFALVKPVNRGESMTTGKDISAVRLPFEAGEHLITWQVPDRKGGHIGIPGLLTVEQGKYPNGILHGDMPIEWVSEGATGVASFPQRHAFDALTGRLSSGAYVALMNGELSYSFPGQGRAVGAFAALSLDQFDMSAHRKYSSIELQIEGLESVAGIAPIAHVKMPMKAGDEQVWTVTVDEDAKFIWGADERSMTFSYDYTVRAYDAYEFRMAFGPVLRLTSEVPLTIVDWWLDWVRPLRQLISLLTGGPREIRYLLAVVADAAPRSHRDQVFGWDITHLPIYSTRASVERIHSAVSLAKDELSLLDLLHAWQAQVAAGHPLFETYGTMATAVDQHPRSRFLLLLQALEGSYGFENRVRHEEDRGRYATKRAGVIERALELLEKPDLDFVDKNLRKEAMQGLDSALADLLKRLPNEVSDELANSDLIQVVRKEHVGKGTLSLQTALTRARNALSHGSGSFDANNLDAVANILERAVRSEAIRLLGAPVDAQKRATSKAER
ncbi:ApeA N-terminal domain 1-containing protein [Galactobacter caseinivorans]|uniref:ApeA N-terminal domain-containing protein n=1 Tax=Galactobacter caseinivorans TaxID=2676123 RepID=A0A496PKC0_9MICC|nr:hypothetical protein [Galactobacter caseinivorans]RKW70954.1 hypothetical protein DWQ67_03865 [Galactobacter caseinivorans]